MNILDNLEQIKKLDRSGVYDSVEQLPQQCLHAWKDTQDLKVPPDYQNINKIIMTGMGGSGLGARIIESVFASQLKYPLVRVNDYDLPVWADDKTLVICSSYSGTTEEIVATARQAQAKNCRWMAICAGGSLLDLARKHQVPYYQIKPQYNPSNQPRMAIGYSVVGQLIMAAKAGLISFAKKDIDALIAVMNSVINQCQQTVSGSQNPAKQTAENMLQKEVVFVAARHLTGAVHTVKNQMNENAKNFAQRHDIPELNHHLMEGLRFPDSNKKTVVFFFAQSQLYPSRIQQRLQLTAEVVKKNHLAVINWQATAKDQLSQAFELIQFGAFVNFYLTMLHGIDPAPIPWVDYFKTKLGQPLGK
jgi:glucose/mannose-6-phosphate isomerase